jgi:RHS repeat-associated protein
LAGRSIAQLEAGPTISTTRYLHTDALGSPVAASGSTGQLLDRTHYEPYGKPINLDVDGIGYAGHKTDADTNLIYMQQRYYDPMVGRFLSVDPVTANSGPASNFNRYWYANNNPYKFTDPDGRLATCDQTSCVIDCETTITCTASYLYVAMVYAGRTIQNLVDPPLRQEQAPEPADDGGRNGTRELGELEPIHVPDHPENDPAIKKLSDSKLGDAINNPADGQKSQSAWQQGY